MPLGLERGPGALAVILGLALGLACLDFVMGASLPREATVAAPSPAKQADSFVDSVGVNTHFKYTDKPYWNQYPTVKQKLYDLSIRHVRDAAYTTRSTDPNYPVNVYYDRMKELAVNGVKTDYIFNPGPEAVDDPSTVVGGKTHFDFVVEKAGNSYESGEGPNEYDRLWPCGDYRDQLRAYQQKLFEASRANTSTASKTVVGPSLIQNSIAAPCVGDLSAYMDVGNIHHYYNSRHPGTTGFGDTADCSGGIAYGNLDYDRNCYSLVSGTNPIWSTETGFHNATTGYGYNENAQAKYVPRALFEHFDRGVPRTYLYELVDFGTDPAQKEHNWGLVRNNLTNKPAYTSVKNTLDLLKDPGASFTPGSLDYSIVGDQTDVRKILFQKRNGKFYLVLWQEVSSMNPDTLEDISVPDKAVTLKLGSPHSVKTYLPKDGTAATGQAAAVTSYNLSVPDHPLIVELTSADPTPPPSPSPPPSPPPATAPVAKADVYTAIEDQKLIKLATLGVLRNDIGTRPLTAKLVTKPRHGTLTLFPKGSFIYKPKPNFFGKDTFTYRAVNSTGLSRAVTVAIYVKSRPG